MCVRAKSSVGPTEKAVPLVFSAALTRATAVPLVFGRSRQRDKIRSGRQEFLSTVLAKADAAPLGHSYPITIRVKDLRRRADVHLVAHQSMYYIVTIGIPSLSRTLLHAIRAVATVTSATVQSP